jgi:hypothetical protein
MARMRVRIALGLAFLATAIGLVIDMSGSAPRLAGDDHAQWTPPAFVATVRGGGVLCTGGVVLPAHAARVVMTIGSTVGNKTVPLPRIGIDFAASGRRTVTSVLSAGHAPGEDVSMPLHYPHGDDADGTLCLHIGGRRNHSLQFGGIAPSAGTTVDGVTMPTRVSMLFYRPGRSSWWSLLGALDLRLGLGKSPIFGAWTLPVIALVALALWFGVARVLIRELREP